jgi:YesN/AraC family two-component response regulator
MRSDLITAIGTTSPHEAKDFIKNNLNTGDVVLSDFHMPEMNGLELAEITAEIRRQKAIKFFIMSGAAEFTGEAQKIKNAIGTHIDGYTAKPFDISELRQLLLGA